MLRFALLLLCCAPLSAQTYTDHLSFGGISPDTAYGVACDSAGNSYGVYHFDGTIDVQPGTGTHDITGFFAGGVVKYDSNRNVTWARLIEPVNPGDLVIPEMPAVDSAGNVYVVGRFFGQADFDPGAGTAIESALDTTGAPAANYNAFLLKLDATGAFQWVRVLRGGYTWGSRVSCTDTRVCITGIYNGTIDLDHTAGTQHATAAGLAGFTAMFDSAGSRVWAQANSTTLLEIPSSPLIGPNNEVTVVSSYGIDLTLTQGGQSYTPTGNVDMLIVRYTATGAVDWVKEVGNAGANVVPAWATQDPAGDFYVVGNWRMTVDFDPGTGTTNLTPQVGLNAFAAKYDAAGDLRWAVPFHSSGDTKMSSCAADANGLVVGGSFEGNMDADPGTGTEMLDSQLGFTFATRLDSNGDHVWSVNFGGTAALGSVGSAVYGMASDGAGTVLLGGPYEGSADWDPGAGTQITNPTDQDGWVVWLDDAAATTTPPPPVLQVTTITISTGTEGTPVNATLTAAGGSGTGYQWTLLTGQLPPGVTGIPGTGTPSITLSGTPTTAGSYAFTVQVEDDASDTATQGYTWVINTAGGTAPPPSNNGGGAGGGGGCTAGPNGPSHLLWGLCVLALSALALRRMRVRARTE